MKALPRVARAKAGGLAAGLAMVLIMGLSVVAWPQPAAAQESASARMPAEAAQAQAQALKLLDRGELAAAAGRFDQAAHWWNQALRLRPGWAKAQARLRELPQRRQRFAQEQAARQQRSRARLQFVEGVACFNAGDYGRAEKLFAEYLAVFPQDRRVAQYLSLARSTGAGLRVGSLQVVCQPRAEVFLDGEPRGATPLLIKAVPVGSHQVKVKCREGESSAVVQIKARALSGVEFSLQGGGLEVLCTPSAGVFLGGRYLGKTPLKLPWLPVGKHQLRLIRDGYRLEERTIVLEQGKYTQLELYLKPEN